MKREKDADLFEKIRDHGWEQGSIFLSCEEDLGVGPSKDKTLFLLVTHSCDVVHESFEDEPTAEAIIATTITIPEAQLTHGKNPRKIHVTLYENNEAIWREFSTAKRVFFDREKLAELKPSSTYSIEKGPLGNLINWLSKKYDRAAFPDEFNRRLAECKIKKNIVDILKKNGHDIRGLFIKLDSYDEKLESEPYKMLIYMVLDDNAENNGIKFEELLEKIVKKLSASKVIQVLDGYRVVTLDEFTLKDIETMQLWDFEYLSYREKPGGKAIKRR